MEATVLGNNCIALDTDDAVILISYETLVCAYERNRPPVTIYVLSSPSRTTAKHIGQFMRYYWNLEKDWKRDPRFNVVHMDAGELKKLVKVEIKVPKIMPTA